MEHGTGISLELYSSIDMPLVIVHRYLHNHITVFGIHDVSCGALRDMADRFRNHAHAAAPVKGRLVSALCVSGTCSR